jgi:isopenicillin N synthase-like dioxygenase
VALMDNAIDTGVGVRKVADSTPGLTSKRLAFSEIPLLDFAAMLGDDEPAKRQLAAEIQRACTEVGFFYIKNHGFPQAVIDRIFAVSREFFAQDLAAKMEIDMARSFNRGYIPLYGEKNNSNTKGDIKEAFDMAIDITTDDSGFAAGNPLYGPNQWPAELPDFKPVMLDYFAAVTLLSQRLYRAFALSLGLPENYFLGMLDKPLDILRLLRYPSQPIVDDADQIGTGAHSDFDCFTVLCQDPSGGLQVLNSHGEWIDALPIDGTFLINVGDMLERWSNGRFVSTVHRVINRSGGERYSIVFFAAPNHATVVECLPGCYSAQQPPKYAPIGAGEYIIARYNEILV